MRATTHGFSLYEMLVVLAIVSMSALVVLSGASARKSIKSASMIATEIAQLAARSSLHARSRGQTTKITIDLRTRIITSDHDQDTPQVRGSVEVPDRYKLSVLTGAELTQGGDLAAINFYDNGTSSGGEITIEESNGAKRTVRILWLTGAIEIIDGARP